VPEYEDIDIAVTRFQRGAGFIPNEASHPAGIVDPAAPGPPHASLSPPPCAGNESPPPRRPARATLYLNRYLQFFYAFVTRPACVKQVWKYNLEFVPDDVWDSWDPNHPFGGPDLPLFRGLAEVIKEVAPRMIIHVLEDRKQKWAESGLISLFANTIRHTMGAINITMERYINPGMGGVRANHWNDLAIEEEHDTVRGEPVDIPNRRDPLFNYEESW